MANGQELTAKSRPPTADRRTPKADCRKQTLVSVLVAYATRHGATREIAEAVAASLRADGLEADALPVKGVRSLDEYTAVVLGAPLYMFHLHADARRFLSRHRRALEQMPVAVFAGGPYGEAGEEVWREVRASLDKELAKFAWLSPVSVEVVGGRFDPTALRFPWSWLPALKGMPASDLRDWEAIRAWAGALVARLHPEPVREGV